MFNIKHFLQICSCTTISESQVLQNALYLLHQNLQKRQLFGVTSRHKEYHGRKLVGFSSDQMYTVVADVKNYYHFVPFCKKSVIQFEKPNFLKADLEIGFPPIVESYTSNVTLIKPVLVSAVCTDGKLFNYLETTWKFSPGLRSNAQTCIIDFSIDFEFKSLLHSQLAHMFFDSLVEQMESAFFLEAKKRYGKESLRTHQLATARS